MRRVRTVRTNSTCRGPSSGSPAKLLVIRRKPSSEVSPASSDGVGGVRAPTYDAKASSMRGSRGTDLPRSHRDTLAWVRVRPETLQMWSAASAWVSPAAVRADLRSLSTGRAELKETCATPPSVCPMHGRMPVGESAPPVDCSVRHKTASLMRRLHVGRTLCI